MAKLTKTQIDELKEKGLITHVIPSDFLANNTVDELKVDRFVVVTDPSSDIEGSLTPVVVDAYFAGLKLSSGPLAYENNEFVIKDSWNHATYGSGYSGGAWGKTEGSTYFCLDDVKEELESLDGWRLPTQSEWESIVGTSRNGSTVNGSTNKHYAFVQLSGTTFASSDEPLGLLLFPDDCTITGKELQLDSNVVTTGVTVDEINSYISQGCAFLPAAGAMDNGSTGAWMGGGYDGYYWSSTEGDETYYGVLLNFTVSYGQPNIAGLNTSYQDYMESLNGTVRLVHE